MIQTQALLIVIFAYHNAFTRQVEIRQPAQHRIAFVGGVLRAQSLQRELANTYVTGSNARGILAG